MLPSRCLSILPRLGVRQLADSKSSQFAVANIHRKDVDEMIDQRGPPTKFKVEDEQAEVGTNFTKIVVTLRFAFSLTLVLHCRKF